MSEYSAKVVWKRQPEEAFSDNKYSRGHSWKFDGGAVVAASSAPSIVPPPYSVEANVDPEEAFIASLSSCHMLFFLAIAGKRGFVIDQYIDNAIGIMEKDAALGRILASDVRDHDSFAFYDVTQAPASDAP